MTDFFVRLTESGRFLQLLAEAKPAPVAPELPRERKTSSKPDAAGRERIERIKNDNPIVQVISRHVELRPSGHNLIGLCPFHEDHVPSFTVYPDTGKFHCYGCGQHGDVISFLREKKGLSFNEALDALDRYSSPTNSSYSQSQRIGLRAAFPQAFGGTPAHGRNG